MNRCRQRRAGDFERNQLSSVAPANGCRDIEGTDSAAADRSAEGVPVQIGVQTIHFPDTVETRRFREASNGGEHMALRAMAITSGMPPEGGSGLRWRGTVLDRRKLSVNQ